VAAHNAGDTSHDAVAICRDPSRVSQRHCRLCLAVALLIVWRAGWNWFRLVQRFLSVFIAGFAFYDEVYVRGFCRCGCLKLARSSGPHFALFLFVPEWETRAAPRIVGDCAGLVAPFCVAGQRLFSALVPRGVSAVRV